MGAFTFHGQMWHPPHVIRDVEKLELSITFPPELDIQPVLPLVTPSKVHPPYFRQLKELTLSVSPYPRHLPLLAILTSVRHSLTHLHIKYIRMYLLSLIFVDNSSTCLPSQPADFVEGSSP